MMTLYEKEIYCLLTLKTSSFTKQSNKGIIYFIFFSFCNNLEIETHLIKVSF